MITGAIVLKLCVSRGIDSDGVHSCCRCVELLQVKCGIVLYSFTLRIVVTVIFCHAIKMDENIYFRFNL